DFARLSLPGLEKNTPSERRLASLVGHTVGGGRGGGRRIDRGAKIMWARIVEAMLGCWLLISPLIIYRAEAPARLWWIDLSLGGLTILLALGSYWPPSRRAHLGLLLVAGVLAGLALVSSDPP